MKKYCIVILLLLTVDSNSFGQQAYTPPVTKQEYLQKSKTRKILGFVLLGAGIISIASVASPETDLSNTATFGVLGGIAIVASIPLFISAGKNKRRAMNASAWLNMETIPGPLWAAHPKNIIPSFCVKFGVK